MVGNVSCALPISMKQPPPYADPPVPSYAEIHSPPPSYGEPLTHLPQNHHQPTPWKPPIFDSVQKQIKEEMVQLDPRLTLQLLALVEALFAALIIIISIVIIESSNDELYFCRTASLFDGYYGIFVGVFNIVLTSAWAFMTIKFPWSHRTPLVFSPTNTNKLVGRIYLSLLTTSIFCSVHLVLFSAITDMNIAREILVIIAVFNSNNLIIIFTYCISNLMFIILVICSSMSAILILFKKPYEWIVVDNTKVEPEVVPATVVDNAPCNLTVVYSTQTDAENI